MKAELKTEWLKALRSGKYKQCRFFLSYDGAYGPLGILCEVARLVKKDVQDKFTKRLVKQYIYQDRKFKTSEDTQFLPKTFRREIKLSAIHEKEIAGLNDDGETFDTIAKYIEKEVEIEQVEKEKTCNT